MLPNPNNYNPKKKREQGNRISKNIYEAASPSSTDTEQQHKPDT